MSTEKEKKHKRKSRRFPQHRGGREGESATWAAGDRSPSVTGPGWDSSPAKGGREAPTCPVVDASGSPGGESRARVTRGSPPAAMGPGLRDGTCFQSGLWGNEAGGSHRRLDREADRGERAEAGGARGGATIAMRPQSKTSTCRDVPRLRRARGAVGSGSNRLCYHRPRNRKCPREGRLADWL